MSPRLEGVGPDRAVPFLEDVDELPTGTCGSLLFPRERGLLGVILVQERRVCWATAEGMRGRLTDILIGESEGALDRAQVEDVYARCRTTGTPLGEGLVCAGVVSEQGLRIALLRHVAEALVAMARFGRTPPTWKPHTHGTYDARFTFSTGEIYAFACGNLYGEAVWGISRALKETLPDGCMGAAFSREGGGRPVALLGGDSLTVAELSDLAAWAMSSVDVAGALDARMRLLVLAEGDRAVAVWSHERCVCLAMCTEPSELSFVVSKRLRSAGR